MISNNLSEIYKKEVESLNPSDVVNYLKDNGWYETEKIVNGMASIWEKNNKQFSLLLPLDKELFDFVIRMTETMETIAYSENMSKTEVFKNLFNN